MAGLASSSGLQYSVGYTRNSLFGIPLEHGVQRESASAGLVISYRLPGYTRKIHGPPVARYWSEESFDCPLEVQIYLAVVSWPICLAMLSFAKHHVARVVKKILCGTAEDIARSTKVGMISSRLLKPMNKAAHTRSAM